MEEERIGGCWTPTEWWSRESAIKYFTHINSFERFKQELSHEVGTHGAVRVFWHFYKLLEERGTPEDLEIVAGRLRTFLDSWFEEISKRESLTKYVISGFLYHCRCWKFSQPEKLCGLAYLMARDCPEYLGVLGDAILISKGDKPPIKY